MTSDDLLNQCAGLICDIGLNLQPGQDVAVNAQIAHAPLARALAEQAYARGAHYVDIWYWDPHGKRSRIRHAPAETLSWTPPWLDVRYQQLGDRRGALVNIVGDPEPGLLAGLDEHRCGLDRMPALGSRFRVQRQSLVAWTFGCCPTPAWAQSLYGKPDVDRLWEELTPILRLDEPDPAAAWQAHLAELRARAADLTARQFSAVRFTGPDTDLTLGLIPGATWQISELTGPLGQPNLVSFPTEEVYTTPDWREVNGHITSTLPLALGGVLAEKFTLTFKDGVIVDVAGGPGTRTVQAHLDMDEGARRLGEVALVDSTSPIRRSGTIFRETLLDENATCHLAWGAGIPSVLPGWQSMSENELLELGVNASATHIDFMVGGEQVTVTGLTAHGTEIPLLQDGAWKLPARCGR